MPRNADKIRSSLSSIPNTILNWLAQNNTCLTDPRKSNEIILKGAKDLAEDYQKLFQSIVDVKMKLENLDEIRKNISIERYEILKVEKDL